MDNKTRNRLLKPLVFLIALWPLIGLLLRGAMGQLGANPIERITHQTGWWTLALLMITLAVTPLRKLTGQYWLVQYRRMLGLFAFFYGCLHMLTYVWLDQFFDAQAIVKDVGKRPFITMGTLSFVLMVPLAATSTQKAIRRLGKRWQTLHKLIYASAAAGVVHFLWLVKKDISEPATFAVVLGLLLGYRVLAAALERRGAQRTAAAAD
ncbi:MAG TPA: protein-methionine-sulfoxide reductase heme-binding subunit MsrQ [Clostridia bacterium]|nr:protein-methionine-sulfoxide reductase heme-binding subunit MsrQ [Clostridia bacterium]